ncbi:MAG: S1 RNA-binding domain-containing protein [Nanoarchaeota archaeon]|nr:S1 RNA-binding domain-containing protein [Nanoarchaeota archaeon]
MLYQKTGYPEEDEIVLCTVKNVQYHSVFADMDHYGGRTGMIHISEVSPGRIRNIRDFVVEGKKIFCKVLRINEEKGYIDLSLRRVNEAQKRRKNDQIKQEQRAEKILEAFAQQHKLKLQDLYKDVSTPIFVEYEYIHEVFNEVVENNFDLTKLGIKKDIAEPLTALIKEKIKPKIVEIGGVLIIKTYEEGGVEAIKVALKKAETDKIIIRYKGGGTYSISVKSTDYKDAEKKLKAAVEKCENSMKKGDVEFKRKE